jgi:ribosomal 30S subunit maturation factor RimM
MGCLLTIKESDSELTAQGWSRQMLWIDKTSLPLLAADQFYHHELWQMRVEHPKHGPLGLVRQVVQSAGADYLVVAADEPTATATDEVMIPLIKIAIAEINRDARSIVLKADWHLQPE